MAMTNKNFSGTSASSATTVYTCPASTTAVINMIQVGNLTSTGVNVTVALYDSSAATTTNFVYQIPVNAGTSVGVLSGGLVLETGDQIKIHTNVAGGVGFVGSVTEIV